MRKPIAGATATEASWNSTPHDYSPPFPDEPNKCGNQEGDVQSGGMERPDKKISSSDVEIEVQHRPQEANGANAESEVHQMTLR